MAELATRLRHYLIADPICLARPQRPGGTFRVDEIATELGVYPDTVRSWALGAPLPPNAAKLFAKILP